MEICNARWARKTRMTELIKKSDIISRFDVMHDCDGRTDGQTHYDGWYRDCT